MQSLLYDFCWYHFFLSVFHFSANNPFSAASGMTVAQIIIGLVANNSVQDRKQQYEVL